MAKPLVGLKRRLVALAAMTVCGRANKNPPSIFMFGGCPVGDVGAAEETAAKEYQDRTAWGASWRGGWSEKWGWMKAGAFTDHYRQPETTGGFQVQVLGTPYTITGTAGAYTFHFR